MEIYTSENMTIKEFNKLKKEIIEKINNIFPEIERLTISASVNKDSESKKK